MSLVCEGDQHAAEGLGRRRSRNKESEAGFGDLQQNDSLALCSCCVLVLGKFDDVR